MHSVFYNSVYLHIQFMNRNVWLIKVHDVHCCYMFVAIGVLCHVEHNFMRVYFFLMKFLLPHIGRLIGM